MDFSPTMEMLVLLFFVAMLAGCIDTMAGGGGLITIPVLLLCQIPPVQALATNKLQGCSGSLTSSLTMLRRRVVRFGDLKIAFLYALLGAAIGAVLIQHVNPAVLDWVIPLVLIIIGLYFLLSPSAGQVERKPRISENLFNHVVVPIIGFYDGFLGPGTGSFFALSGVALKGLTIIKATGSAKVLNFATNIASLVIFVISGKVLWIVGFAMIGGQVIGSYAGSLLVINHGSKFIRPVIVLVCFIMVVRYLYQKF